MTERNHDHEPGPAALDELARAFGLDSDDAGSDEANPDGRADADTERSRRRGDDVPAVPTEDRDLPEAGGDVAATSHATTASGDASDAGPAGAPPPASTGAPVPRIVRIDDITGSVGVGDPTPVERAPGDPSAGEPGARFDDAPDAASGRSGSGASGSGESGLDAASPEPPVISIEVDDLPDAVYVAGSLESDSSRAIVFIEDDSGADALQPESDRDLRRGIEPRMRERRLQVRRAQSRKRLKWAVAGAIVVLLAIGALAVLGSTLFAVQADEITVTGNVYTDAERLDAVLEDLIGTPTLRVDTQRIERELEQIPWVDDAKVTVRFPRSASIEIRERQAIASYQGPDGRFRVLDREGRVLDVLDDWPIAYVYVVGPDAVDLEPGQFAPFGYVGAAELAKNLTGSVRGQVDRIEVTADGQRLSMLLDDGTEVRFGEARDLFTKLVRLETRLADPEREPGPIDVATN